MIEMWDEQFRKIDNKIDDLWKKMELEKHEKRKDKLVKKIYSIMHENLNQVWKGVYCKLVNGGIACINIGDATRSINGIFRLFPNHAKVIENCEKIGFITLPSILWKKPTTKPKYKGKGAFLGSGMLPPNAYVTQDCEFILIFRKGGLRKFVPHDPLRYQSAYEKEERNNWFTQIWDIVGVKQSLSSTERRAAAFPEEIPRRLIKMFSIIGDTVLDPFLGTGTTTKVAKELGRNSIGYEIDSVFLPMIKEKVGISQKKLTDEIEFEVIEDKSKTIDFCKKL
jgi:site-specific DNA-methyltransferase (cytosine-N4-specific)